MLDLLGVAEGGDRDLAALRRDGVAAGTPPVHADEWSLINRDG